MALTGEQALGSARKYVKDTMRGLGAMQGEPGKSAYQSALDSGFVGTEKEWIESLSGKDGEPGQNGAPGQAGDDGISPIITESNNNTDDIYKLTITDTNGSFETPNLMGRQGIQGIKGERGEQGETGKDGTTYTPSIGTVTTVDSANAASVDVVVDSENNLAEFNFSIPRGEQGEQGEPGVTYTPTIGTITTVENTEDAQAEVIVNTETGEAAFNFSIPKGSDANVTSENIEAALGYTPANSETLDEVQDTIDNLATSIANGESITIDDSANAPFISLVVDGKSEQSGTPIPENPQTINSVADSGSVEVVSTGKNLLDIVNLEERTHNGVTGVNNQDGSYTVNGTNTGNESLFSCQDAKTYLDKLERGVEYIASITGEKNQNGITGLQIEVYEYVNNGWRKLCSTTTKSNFTISENATDLIIRLNVRPNTTITNAIAYPMVRLATVENDTFEPYTETKATLTLSQPLRSLPNGTKDELVFNADGTGKIIRRIASVVYDGSDDEGWEINTNYGDNTVIWTSISNMRNSSIVRCSHYLYTDALVSKDYGVTTGQKINIRNINITTLNDFKTWLSNNNVTVQYELATPTEEELTAEQLSEILNLHTYESVSNINTTDSLQPNLEVEYYKNTNVGKTCVNLVNKVNNVVKVQEELSISDIIRTTEKTFESVAGGCLLTKLEGKSTQASYTGKNLLEVSKFSTTTQLGITYTPVYNENGLLEYINVKGTCTGNYYFLDLGVIPLESGNYIVSFEGNVDVVAQVYGVKDGVSTYLYTKSDGSELTITYDTSLYDELKARMYVTNGTTINNVNIKPMIRKAENTDNNYEPYVGGIPSPSPNYPQAINSVADSGSVEVVSHGKNLWDGTFLNYGVGGSTDKETLIVNNEKYRSIIVPVAEGQIYTVSRGAVLGNRFRYGFIKTEHAPNVNVYYIGTYANGLTMTTIPVPKDCKYLVVYLTNQNDVDKVENTWFQIELGDTATDYVPYQGEIRTTMAIESLKSLPNGVKDELILNSDGTGKVIRQVGETVLDGSSDEGWRTRNDIVVDDFTIFRQYNYVQGDGLITNTAGICSHFEVLTENKFDRNNVRFLNTSGFGICVCVNNTIANTIESFETWLSQNPVTVQYQLETPTEETLTTEQVKELLKLKTFDDITNVVVNDVTNPIVEVEYGTSKVGAYTLLNLQKQITNEIKLNELLATTVGD